MNNKPYSQILDSLARDYMADSIDLAPRVLSRIQKGKQFSMKPRTKLVTAILLVLITFVVLSFTVPGVAAAIQRWFGYVPGVGLVREGQIRRLAEPVSQTRDGVTVTVEQAMLQQDSVTITYKVEGLPASARPVNPPADFCTKPMDPILRFGDWQTGMDTASGVSISGLEDGYEAHYKFALARPAPDEAVFVLACIYNVRVGGAPEDWTIPLHFVPAPPDMTAFPVIEIPSPTAPVSTVTPSGNTAADTAAISLTLDRVVPMGDGTLIYATLHWEKTDYFLVDFSTEESIRLLDADGQEVPFERVYDENTLMDQEQRRTPFAIRSALVQVAGPLTIIVDTLKVGLAEIPEKASFTFDAGPDPQPMQSWQLNQDIQIGKYSLRVVSVDAYPGGISFLMASDTIVDASPVVPGHPACAGGYGGENGQFQVSTTFCDADFALSGPVTIEIVGISVRLDGPWQVQWTPTP
jgi:hypothetical protein